MGSQLELLEVSVLLSCLQWVLHCRLLIWEGEGKGGFLFVATEQKRLGVLGTCVDLFLRSLEVSYWDFTAMWLLGSGRWVVCKGEGRHKTVWRYHNCFLNSYLEMLHFKFAYSIFQSCVSMNSSVWVKLLVAVCFHSEKLVLGIKLVWSLLNCVRWSLCCRSILKCQRGVF